MDRTEYLQMCQKVSTLENGLCGVKQNIPAELLVKHNGIIYYPQAYELSFDNGTPIHKAILHDLKVNAITYVDLVRVAKNDNEVK